MTCKEWDDAAIAAGVDLDAWGWGKAGAEALGEPRPPGPSRTPSTCCRSGKRPYCTCDACY
jgi:hypothetical protein